MFINRLATIFSTSVDKNNIGYRTASFGERLVFYERFNNDLLRQLGTKSLVKEMLTISVWGLTRLSLHHLTGIVGMGSIAQVEFDEELIAVSIFFSVASRNEPRFTLSEYNTSCISKTAAPSF